MSRTRFCYGFLLMSLMMNPRRMSKRQADKRIVPVIESSSSHMRNPLYHAIAKWLAENLKPLQHQLAPRSYRDTFKFIDNLNDVNLSGMGMFSLGVSSLFTNVPVTETIDQIYRRIDGIAIGSLLGPLLADIFMGKLDKFQLSDQIYKLKPYGHYVDDIFAIATNDTNIYTLLNAVNQAHPSIEFKLEMETAVSFPFLDVLLSRRPDENIYGFGNEDSCKTTEEVDVFNTLERRWGKVAPMHKARNMVGAVVLKQRIFVCGGGDTSCEIYDPPTDT
ncbi:unnamed protein product [Dibothriocephalus latus]|uniref:Reverse transcriptase domain-containing protein n=1 Tax=Dibothriocephalus latus TaxID=60516 RepID=A0A3P7PZT5_DIBLA|nr:unnamed protein product [Dibothriocephalus latus]